jgi:hypothetical protein
MDHIPDLERQSNVPLSSYPSARRVIPVLSVLALLAMWVAAPVRADSSGSQYEDATPNACGDAPCQGGGVSGGTDKGSSPKGTASNSPDDESSTPEGGLGGGSPDGAESEKQAGHPDDKATGKDDQTKVPVKATDSASKAGDTDDGGGSSPLVPILIAFAVLAAISVGVLVYRRKHQSSATSDGS